MVPAAEALARLQRGNAVFAAAVRDGAPLPGPELRADRMGAPQEPCAAILTCADSRVVPEWIFQQGIGEIFVVRVAGDVPVAACVESLEYAVAHLDVRLVVVLGHTRCGAVQATLAEALAPRPADPLPLPVTMGRILPTIERLRAARPELAGDELELAAIHADVHETVRRLTADSGVLARARAEDGLLVTGAVYDTDGGGVAFLEEEGV